MASTRIEVGRIEVDGDTAYSVRVVENGTLTIEAQCNSLDEAKQIAEKESDRLRVSIVYRLAKL